MFRQSLGAIKDETLNSEQCSRNIIPLNPVLNPIYKVNFVIETDDLSNKSRERVILELWSNGSIHPRQAIHEASLALMDLFSTFRKLFHIDSHSSGSKKKRSSLHAGIKTFQN